MFSKNRWSVADKSLFDRRSVADQFHKRLALNFQRLDYDWSATGCSASVLSFWHHYTCTTNVESVYIIVHSGGKKKDSSTIVDGKDYYQIFRLLILKMNLNCPRDHLSKKYQKANLVPSRTITTTTAEYWFVVSEATVSIVLSWWQLAQKCFYSF